MPTSRLVMDLVAERRSGGVRASAGETYFATISPSVFMMKDSKPACWPRSISPASVGTAAVSARTAAERERARRQLLRMGHRIPHPIGRGIHLHGLSQC